MLWIGLVIVLVYVSLSVLAFNELDVNCNQYDLVNVFIGTGGAAFGYGGVSPSAQMPFGPLRLGPDTMNALTDIGYRHFCGYNYLDTTIRAFSHTHLVGAGVDDLAQIGVMPYRIHKEQGAIIAEKDIYDYANRFWWSKFNKSTEFASPGRYQVHLDKPNVDVNLLAISTNAGIHKYTWKSTDIGTAFGHGLAVDLCHTAVFEEFNIFKDNKCIGASLNILNNGQSFSGSMVGSGHHLEVFVHADIVVTSKSYSDVQVTQWRTCNGFSKGSCATDATSISTTDGVLYTLASFGRKSADNADAFPLFNADRGDFEVEVRVGISFISTEQAHINLQEALSTTNNFDRLSERTKTTWCRELSLLDVTAQADDEDMTGILASANYRLHLTPTIYSEVGGVYLGMDDLVHNATADRIASYGDRRQRAPQSYNFYSDLSLWDTFRTAHPWWLLTDEDLGVGIARSTADITVQQGAFPKWTLGNREGGHMIGNSGSALVLEAIKSDLGKEFDVKTIQEALQKQSTMPGVKNGRTDCSFYLTNGYVSMESSDVATSLTVTDAYDDSILAGISEYVGATADAEAALNRSTNYKNLWSPEHQYMCPRSSTGEFHCAKNPIGPASWNANVEGDTLHWSWFVPHDAVGLMKLFPSPAAYDAKLSEFLEKHVEYTERFGTAVPNPYFWVGNEHDSFAVWMFNYGPNCTRTQYWTRKVTHESFSNTYHGIPGNEDYGAMASWVMFASLGLFPQPGSTSYLLGSPRVSSASLRLRDISGVSSTLTIKTINNSAENVFVQKLLVNGAEWTSPFIDRSVLTASSGCTLEFYMQPTPASGLCA